MPFQSEAMIEKTLKHEAWFGDNEPTCPSAPTAMQVAITE
jgi:hypothetical protein